MLLKLLLPLLVGLLLFSVANASYFWISKKLEQARKKREAELLTNNIRTQVENIEDHQELIKLEKIFEVRRARRQFLTKRIFMASCTTLILSGVCMFIFSNEQISKMVHQAYLIATFATAYSGFCLITERSAISTKKQK